jgi:hypothetical protein
MKKSIDFFKKLLYILSGAKKLFWEAKNGTEERTKETGRHEENAG